MEKQVHFWTEHCQNTDYIKKYSKQKLYKIKFNTENSLVACFYPPPPSFPSRARGRQTFAIFKINILMYWNGEAGSLYGWTLKTNYNEKYFK